MSVGPLRFGSFGLVAVAVTIVARHLVDCLAVSGRVAGRIVDRERNLRRENRPLVHGLVVVDMVVGSWHSMAFAFAVVAS